MTWTELYWQVIPYDQRRVRAAEYIGQYVLYIVSIIQLLCLYLGFDFANKFYSKCCSPLRTLCEKCCKSIALHQISKDVDGEYRKLEAEQHETELAKT